MTIRILLADAHANMRKILRDLIGRQPGMRVVAEAENGRDLLRLAAGLKPDVLVMDTQMTDAKGAEGIRRLIAQTPSLRVLALSMHASRQFADGMLAAGAVGYLLKDQAFEELIRAILTVAEGRIYRCPGIADSASAESG